MPAPEAHDDEARVMRPTALVDEMTIETPVDQ